MPAPPPAAITPPPMIRRHCRHAYADTPFARQPFRRRFRHFHRCRRHYADAAAFDTADALPIFRRDDYAAADFRHDWLRAAAFRR